MPVGNPPYIPPRDTEFAAWLDNFSTLITASPATYGLIAADAVVIAAQNTAFGAALTAATGMGTRSPVTVAAKNVAKINALAIVRPYAQQVSLNAGVIVDDKIALGVNPRTNTPTPIPAPTQAPILSIVGATPLQHTLRFAPTDSPTSRGKPFGAMTMQLFALASATAVTDQAALAFVAQITKNPVAVDWDAGDTGKQAYYAARFVTRAGLVGPWSDIINFTIAN